MHGRSDNVRLLGEGPCFISSSSASPDCKERALPEPHVGDPPSPTSCSGRVGRQRRCMVRSASRRARPTTPPTTPPAIAAVFDFGGDVTAWITDWPAAFTVVALPESEIEVWKPCAAEATVFAPAGVSAVLVDVGDDAKLLIEEDVVLGIEAPIADRKPKSRSSLELKARKLSVRFSGGQPSEHG